MQQFFASGRVADLLLGILLLEAVAIAIYARVSADPGVFGRVAPSLLPGALLMIALRLALTGAWWGWIALAIAASLPAHLLDLRNRLRR